MSKRTLSFILAGSALVVVGIVLAVATMGDDPPPPDAGGCPCTETACHHELVEWDDVDETAAAEAPAAEAHKSAADASTAETVAEATTEPAPETPEPDAFDVPDGLEGVFDKTKGAVGRMKAVDALPDRLPAKAIDALDRLLNETGGDEGVRNNVANKLRRAGGKRLADDLARMAWDKRETPKWRNYCVQHLYACYEQGGGPAILDTLFKAADPAETDEKMVRICAIWSLARAATPRDKRKTLDEPTLGKIRDRALGALRDKDADYMIRTAGVQSCARLGLKKALPDIREIARDDTQPLHLRVVSAAALGDMGDDSDLAVLDRLAAGPKGRLKSAAAHAAKRIKARVAAPSR
jgi:HEAT repeat protein